MVKTYLRYVPKSNFGVVSSPRGNAVFDQQGKLAITSALEKVNVWNIRKGTLEASWEDGNNKAEVTCLARSVDGQLYAVGYNDGAIRVFRLGNNALVVTFNGHRSAVTTLSFDRTSTLLVSGARDTDVILWNVVGEAGVCRLRGHKDQVTTVHFVYGPSSGSDGGQASHIVSASKDTLVKLWDLDTQHCTETIVIHRSEVWSLAIHPEQTYLVSGSSDRQLRVWKLHLDRLGDTPTSDPTSTATGAEATDPGATSTGLFEYYGEIPRQKQDRVAQVQFDPTGRYLGCLGTGKQIEVYRLRSMYEIQKKMNRRLKRLREKSLKKEPNSSENAPTEVVDSIQDMTIGITDELVLEQTVHSAARVRSFDFLPQPQVLKRSTKQVRAKHPVQLLVALHTNEVEVYDVPETVLPAKSLSAPASYELREPQRLYAVELPGHRAEPRAVALSSDDELLATVSEGQVKVWNTHTGTCIRTMECGFALCCAFLPGDKHVVVGTKSGHLQLFDLSSSTVIESIEAHGKEVWSVAVRPDRRGLVSGAGDQCVKFWEFELVDQDKAAQDENTTGAATRPQKLTLVHTRSLEMGESVLAVQLSQDMQYLAVSLLDSTVKVFFADSLKFRLSLYGHKLPVLSLDISTDNSLIVTGSADKNVKIWGMDFGDCHRSLFAHQDSVMCVRFVPQTHYFVTAGKDQLVKYWDADKFEQIMKFDGHHGQVWSVAVSRYGNWIVSTGQDHSVRIWERTDEPLFLEEEREREMEELHEANLIREMDKTNLNVNIEGTGGEDEPTTTQDEAGRAGRQTMETLKAGERVMEALELAETERIAMETYEKMKDKGPLALPLPPKNPLLVAMGDVSPERHLLNTLGKVRPSEMEDALLILPFTQVAALLPYFNIWIQRKWNIGLVCRVLFFLLRVHHQQLIASRELLLLLNKVRDHLRAHLKSNKDTIGFNLAGLRFLRDRHQASITANYFDEDQYENALSQNTLKRKTVTLA
ncbi:beta transducin [Dispira simplex]|nr:beta transducin [Dispira simplex]